MEKAYRNLEFLLSREARSLRILSEYLEPQSRFEHYNVTDTVVFFGSARSVDLEKGEAALKSAQESGVAEEIERAEYSVRLSRYYEDARTLARRMTEWSKSLDTSARRFIVCSGGGNGLARYSAAQFLTEVPDTQTP